MLVGGFLGPADLSIGCLSVLSRVDVNSLGARAGCSAEDNLNSGVLPSISAVISVALRANAGVVNSMNPKLDTLEEEIEKRKKEKVERKKLAKFPDNL